MACVRAYQLSVFLSALCPLYYPLLTVCQAGRSAPRSSGPSRASTKEDATRLGFRGGDGGDGGDDGGGGA